MEREKRGRRGRMRRRKRREREREKEIYSAINGCCVLLPTSTYISISPYFSFAFANDDLLVLRP